MERFKLVQNRKPWNLSAQVILDISQLLIAHSNIITIYDLFNEIKNRFNGWCVLNKKNAGDISITMADPQFICINKKDSTDGPAFTIRLLHYADIIVGEQGSGKTTVALNMALRDGGTYLMMNASEFRGLKTMTKFFESRPLVKIIIDECPPDFPQHFTRVINNGVCKLIFICQQDPVIPPHSPFVITKLSARQKW